MVRLSNLPEVTLSLGRVALELALLTIKFCFLQDGKGVMLPILCFQETLLPMCPHPENGQQLLKQGKGIHVHLGL